MNKKHFVLPIVFVLLQGVSTVAFFGKKVEATQENLENQDEIFEDNDCEQKNKLPKGLILKDFKLIDDGRSEFFNKRNKKIKPKVEAVGVAFGVSVVVLVFLGIINPSL